MFSRVAKLIESIIVVFFVLLVVLTFAQIVARFVFNYSFGWIEELTRYFFIWIIFVGTALGFRYSNHIRLDILVSFLPRFGQRMVEFINALAIIGFLAVLAYYGWNATLVTMRQFSPAIGLKMGYVYAAIPIGAAFTTVFIVETLFHKPEQDGEEDVLKC